MTGANQQVQKHLGLLTWEALHTAFLKLVLNKQDSFVAGNEVVTFLMLQHLQVAILNGRLVPVSYVLKLQWFLPPKL